MNETEPDYVYGDVIRPDLLRLIPQDGFRIGSVGCGTGVSEYEIVKQGREVHGVDISEQAIAIARTRLTSARVVGPGDYDVFDPESLDGLILADVIEHIPCAWVALREFVRSVKPGGWVVISVPNMRHWSVFARFVIQGEWPENPTGIFDATHVQFMTKKRLGRWCRDAGLLIDHWVDRFDPIPKRRKAATVFDILTLRLFHEWTLFQLQCICRVPPIADPANKALT